MPRTVRDRLEELLEYCSDETQRLQGIRQNGTSEYENARAIGGIEAMDRVAKRVSLALDAAAREARR